MKKVLIAGRLKDVPNYIYALEKTGIEPVVAMKLPTEEGYGPEDFSALLLPGGDDVDPSFFGQGNHGSRTKHSLHLWIFL